ncbi:MAG: hypothetical protein LBV52_05110, partial [Spirochaetaceae bacterium]|nr:hypothetical protein [Spirochaetaceae bacterium]
MSNNDNQLNKKPKKQKELVTYSKVIETRYPKNIKSASSRDNYFNDKLREMSFSEVKNFYRTFVSPKIPALGFANLARRLLDNICWNSVDEFDSWLVTLSEDAQRILYKVVMYIYVPEVQLKKTPEEIITVEHKDYYYYRNHYIVDPLLNLDVLSVITEKEQRIFYANSFIRDLLLPWFVPPPEGEISGCAAQAVPNSEAVYNNENDIVETFPLLVDAVNYVIKDADLEKVPRGFSKKQRTELMQLSGFKDFPQLTEDIPCAQDLAARFVLSMCNYRPAKVKNSQDQIKIFIQDFFSTKVRRERSDVPKLAPFEQIILLTYLNKKITAPTCMDTIPKSRQIFFNL